mmetsp:Transcript_27260/g.40272  ORF Transcript_27260/g.40272 Transcript_27260/m.40272 type:complete len:505 (-) Transcript_27260:18-1532(-)
MPNSTLLQLMGLPLDEDDISYDICLDLSKASWSDVENRITTHPSEATEEDCLHGNSPLEIILKSKSKQEIPLDIYRKILEKKKDEVEEHQPNQHQFNEGIFIYVCRKKYREEYMKNLVSLLLDHMEGADGRKLIEMTIWYRNLAAANAVLARYPDCLLQRDDIKGQIPLHVACVENNDGTEMIQLLLLEGVKKNVGGLFGAGGLYVKDNKGNTPLSQLIQCMNNPFAWDSELVTLCVRVAFEASQSQMMDGLQEMDQSMHDQQPEVSIHFPILHEAMKIASPDSFYRIIEIVKDYDVELSGTDRRGRTALIQAIYLNDEERVQQNVGGFGSKLQYTRKISTKEIISMIVSTVQSNCGKNRDGAGRLPLHIATELGLRWDEGICDIVYANRHGLKERHCVTGLYSFMTAAAVSDADLGTIYKLLRAKPMFAKKRTNVVRIIAAGGGDESSDNEESIIGSTLSFRKPVHGPIIPNSTWDTEDSESSENTKATLKSTESISIIGIDK